MPMPNVRQLSIKLQECPWAAPTPQALAEITPSHAAGKDCIGRDAYEQEGTFYLQRLHSHSSGSGVLLCTT